MRETLEDCELIDKKEKQNMAKGIMSAEDGIRTAADSMRQLDGEAKHFSDPRGMLQGFINELRLRSELEEGLRTDLEYVESIMAHPDFKKG